MQYKSVNLFSSFGNQKNLDVFAKEFFFVLGVFPYEERESSNYIDGYYFKGVKNNLTFTVFISDEVGYDDFPFIVCISAKASEGEKFTVLVNEIIQTKFISKDFRFSQIIHWGEIGKQEVKPLMW